jgi:hypothetical protein
LGWRPGINEEAEELNHIDVTIKKIKPIEGLETVVIDEAGMMSEDMLFSIVERFEELYNYDTDNITMWLFLDPYQLLPVKGLQIQIDPDNTTTLTTQHRAESQDVVKLFTESPEALSSTGFSTHVADNYLVLRASGNYEPTANDIDALMSATLAEAITEKITSFTPSNDAAVAARLAAEIAAAASVTAELTALPT